MKTLRPSLSQALRARHAALLASYPMLKRSTMGPKRLPSYVLACQNIERLLVDRFPKVVFKVSLDPSVTSTTVAVEWTQLPGAPSLEEVGALVSVFKSEHLPAREPHQAHNPQALSRHAFWVLFGFVGEVALQQRAPCAVEVAAEQARVLERTLPSKRPQLLPRRF